MADLMTIGIIGVIVGRAMTYIIKQKKAGVRCVGCSFAGTCSGKCDSTDANPLVKQFHQDYGK